MIRRILHIRAEIATPTDLNNLISGVDDPPTMWAIFPSQCQWINLASLPAMPQGTVMIHISENTDEDQNICSPDPAHRKKGIRIRLRPALKIYTYEYSKNFGGEIHITYDWQTF